jgi:hypothetical protein
MCPWCRVRRRGRYLSYGRAWAWWRRRFYCPRCAPPSASRAGRLAIAHNALITEIRRLHADVLGIDGPEDGETDNEFA